VKTRNVRAMRVGSVFSRPGHCEMFIVLAFLLIKNIDLYRHRNVRAMRVGSVFSRPGHCKIFIVLYDSYSYYEKKI